MDHPTDFDTVFNLGDRCQMRARMTIMTSFMWLVNNQSNCNIKL